jgi:hypothetical protein
MGTGTPEGPEWSRLRRKWTIPTGPKSDGSAFPESGHVAKVKGTITLRAGIENRLVAVPETGPVRRERSLEKALEFLDRRCLARRPGNLARIVYLASFRDSQNGSYAHDALIAEFGRKLTSKAMARAHMDAFQAVLRAPLERNFEDFLSLLDSLTMPDELVVGTWRRHRVCRTMVPIEATSGEIEIFSLTMEYLFLLWEGRNRAHAPADRAFRRYLSPLMALTRKPFTRSSSVAKQTVLEPRDARERADSFRSGNPPTLA